MRALRFGMRKALPIFVLLATLIFILIASTAGSTEIAETRKDVIQKTTSTYIDYKAAWNGGTYFIRGADCCQTAEFVKLHENVTVRGDEFTSLADFKVGEDRYLLAYHVRNDFGKPRVVKEVLLTVNGEKVNRILWGRE